MLDYLIYLIFILSVAMAAGGVVISSKMRNSFRNDIFSTLLYYQVFIYTFGFYGIWGQVAIKAFLADYISAELLQRLSDVAILMGLPFLVFAWLMLLQFSIDISGRKRTNWFTSLFLISNFSILIISWIYYRQSRDYKTCITDKILLYLHEFSIFSHFVPAHNAPWKKIINNS